MIRFVMFAVAVIGVGYIIIQVWLLRRDLRRERYDSGLDDRIRGRMR